MEDINNLIIKLNRYSIEDKAKLSLLLSLQACNYLDDFKANRATTPPWLVDGFATLCVLSNPSTKFHKDILVDGIKDKNLIFDKLYNQIPNNWNTLLDDISYITNVIGNPQINYQKDHDAILYRYHFIFGYFRDELMELTNGVEFEKFVFAERLFSVMKELAQGGTDIFSFSREFFELMPELIAPLSICRDELIEKTNTLLGESFDLSDFSYSFKFITSYPFVIYEKRWFLFAIHNFLNAITYGFINRITEKCDANSIKFGNVLEKYIFKIIDESNLVKSIEDDSECYYIKKQEYKKPDISFVYDDTLVVIESKKAWSILKSTFNDNDSIKCEIKKGVEACEKSLKNIIRFFDQKYTLCGKLSSSYKDVFLVICVENDNYWPKETIINMLKANDKFKMYVDFIENNLFITSLYNLESYFLYGKSVIGELKRNKNISEKHTVLKNSGNDMKRNKAFQSFIDEDETNYMNYAGIIKQRFVNKLSK